MRKHFFKYLIKLAKKDPKIMFLTDDLGFGHFEEFRELFPKQFINCGITEQSMIGIAAGLACGGMKPYCYGTIPFVLMRPYEQLRDDVAYANLNVKIIGYGMSGFIGFTHNLEGKENVKDLLKNLPNIKLYEPKNEKQLAKAMVESHKNKKPAFIKI